MSRVLLPREPVGTPVSTIVWFDGLLAGRKRQWLVRFACGHEARVRRKPKVGDRHACRRCAALRTPRAYREVVHLAKLGLTEREVEYLAGRLAEQRDRRDDGR